MTDKAQDNEFMKQYVDTCKEQIEKLASEPNLLQKTMKPFVQMSLQLMACGMLERNMPSIIPDMGGMDINKMIAQMQEMYNYIKSNHKELMRKDVSQIQELDDSSRRLRGWLRN